MPSDFRILPHNLVVNLESAPYGYAVTMPGIPHYYTLQEDWADPAVFTWTVWEMRKHEVVRPFVNRQQHYLDINGFSYWTMGSREEETILINRQFCTHGAYDSGFDAMAQRYDVSAEHWTKVELDRNALYALAKPSGRVLDIGCGTGLLVDYQYRWIDRERYVGVDPSAAMLTRFALKHPDYKADATLLRTTFEDFHTELRFDTIVAMAGSASHVTGIGMVEKTHHLLAPGGRALLMYYHDPGVALQSVGLEKPPPLAPTPSGAVREAGYDVIEITRPIVS